MTLLVVDGANVVGSRPDGWWRDRPGAARRLHDRLRDAALDHEVVLVLEGAARRGQAVGQDGSVETVHAPGSGDDAIVALVAERGRAVVVTADHELGQRVRALGATTRGPNWLLDQL